eukprot:2564932-Prymnesium_polylepis.1
MPSLGRTPLPTGSRWIARLSAPSSSRYARVFSTEIQELPRPVLVAIPGRTVAVGQPPRTL